MMNISKLKLIQHNLLFKHIFQKSFGKYHKVIMKINAQGLII